MLLARKGTITVDDLRFAVCASKGASDAEIYQGCVAFGRSIENDIAQGRIESDVQIIIGLGDETVIGFDLVEEGS